ncbi:Structural maintenance of chromosomes protein 5 [Stygiomarasmius scandens]|uniref:Structural maintenance of chromosomes protein 5 n=1 Tax=Marasmiellus scandens TaxID=2682957 RepID=A0ABR1ISW4_9AGAR
MARQTRASSSDNDSLKENQNVSGSVRVKMEKVNKQQMKAAGATRGKKARVVEEEEEDAEEEDERDESRDADGDGDEEDEDERSGSPKGRKRVRVNSDGDSRPADNEDEPALRTRSVTLPRDTDGFIPGSIVRIQLRNFVTYDFVEFRTGPYLNMIIGPNGTGKSSIACAICLGLNWPPAVLGRAQDIHSFVKQGTEDGHIEIELKGPKGKPNLVIRRHLKANSKASTFTLNGKAITGKEITAKMVELNVQIGNLCSFLPQDKVSEFAAMSPQQLLRETQRAAGDSNLTSWHDSLIEFGKEHRSIAEKVKEESDQLKQMKERNEAIEKEVERFNQRKQIEEEIATLELFIPGQKYRELLEEYHTIKAEQRRLHKKVAMLKQKNQPAHDLLDSLKTKHKQLEKVRETRKTHVQGKFNKLKKIWNDQEGLEGQAEELEMKLEQLKESEKQRIRDIRGLEKELENMQQEYNKKLDVEDEEEIKRQARAYQNQRNQVASKREDLQASTQDFVKNRYVPTENKREDTEKRLKQLDNVDAQKMAVLANFNKDTHDAVLWLRANKHQFKMEVIEPAIISLTVPDRRFADAVESSFNGTQLKTFVFQCREDYDKFNDLVNDRGALGRRVRIATYFRDRSAENQLVPPPLSPDESVALNGNAVNIEATMQAVGRAGGASFVAGRVMNTVTRSRYGKQAVSNMTRDARQAKIFGGATVDLEQKRQFEKQIQELDVELGVLNEERRKMQAEIDGMRQEEDDIEEKLAGLRKRHQVIANERKKKEQLKLKIGESYQALDEMHGLKSHAGNVQKQIKHKKSAPSLDVERQNIKQKITDTAKRRLKYVKEYTDLAQTIVVDQMENTRIGLEYLQVGANRTYLESVVEKYDAEHQDALREFGVVDTKFNKIKDEAREALDYSRAVINDAPQELREKWDVRERNLLEYAEAKKEAQRNGAEPPLTDGVDLRTADELEEELQTQKAKLELTMKSNPGVVEQFEKRKRDIELLENTLSGRQANAARVDKTVKSLMNRWRPALEKLIESIGEKFSAAFDRIGCAGEIRIREHDEYEKWAIDILVKFRDEEKLQLLTGQRQSGGERSLTTILYLMSLTEEARAPFSLVDEINQGMDQRAERVVHNSMVEVTCKDEAAQYFLITPKLLPNLQYHKRMKVLCVNNGEWLPEENGLGNMMRMIEGYLGAQGGSS